MSPRRSIASVLLLLHCAGCTSWRPSTLTPEQSVPRERELRVELADRSLLTVRDPWVQDDRLGGEHLLLAVGAVGIRRRTEPVPLDSIVGVQARRFDVWKTTALTLAGAALVGVTVLAVSCQNRDPKSATLVDLCPSP